MILFSCTQKNHTITITYPYNNCVFPPEYPASSFRWEPNSEIQKWNIEFYTQEKLVFSDITDSTIYFPNKENWELLKSRSQNQTITCILYALSESEKKIGSQSIQFHFAKDSVGASIFFRSVLLPFSYANQHKDSLQWKLGTIASSESPKMLLTNIPVCANCHSFPQDGSKLAMDIDNANNKGSYTIMDIEKISTIDLNTIMSWDEYKKDDGEKTFGLLAQISPDGKRIVSMLKDRSIFVPIDNNFAYSQLFFPIKGILVVYNIDSETFKALPGADNKELVQASPAWSPDGNTIAFSRAVRTTNKELDTIETMVIDPKYAREFLDKKKDFKYDIYTIPYNNGNGGIAKPLKGASNNEKSNFFAKYSPDGKWIVFCQAENFMLLQEDSKLYIVPAEGGEARLMNCNTESMNSWHSWSPNGKWLIYATKERGAYTQLYLTYIDKQGNDSPPIWLEYFDTPNYAINIPEFVNIKYSEWDKIQDEFSSEKNYFQRAISEAITVSKDNKKALKYINLLIETNPEQFNGYIQKADILAQENKPETLAYYLKGLELLSKEIQKKPNNTNLLQSKAYVLSKIGKHKEAEQICNTILSFNPNNYETFKLKLAILIHDNKIEDVIKECSKYLRQNPSAFEIMYLRSKMYEQINQPQNAIQDLNTLLSYKPNDGEILLRRAFIYFSLKNYSQSLSDVSKVIEMGMFHYSPFYLKARNNFFLGNIEQAKKDILKSIELCDIMMNVDPNVRERKIEIEEFKRKIFNAQ